MELPGAPRDCSRIIRRSESSSLRQSTGNPMQSAAVVNYSPEPGSVEIREVGPPEIGSQDVLLEVSHVGVCGSDLHQWTARHSWPVNYPVVLGHEFGGHVVAVGNEVEGWSEGDRVVSETAAVIDPA